jgi:O-antigen/teichoic acid export membrane protein
MGLIKINRNHKRKKNQNPSIINKEYNYTQQSQINDATPGKLNSDLKKILTHSSFLFIGTIIDAILGLICTILIARYYNIGEYGIYSLTVFLVTFIHGLAGIGIHEANSRYIAIYRGNNDYAKIHGIIKTSFLLVTISSTIITVVLFSLSRFIADSIFHIQELTTVFSIFILAIPFWSITALIVSVFRGFERVKPKVYFTFISVQILKVLFFTYIIINGLPLEYIFWGFFFAVLITFIIALSYFYLFYYKKTIPSKKSTWHIKEILSFSWPLLFSGLAWFLISGLDKVMLGILKSEVEVGYYNAATPIARYLIFFYTIIVFVFQPIASRLYAQSKIEDLKKNYQVLSKWLITIAFPFIMILLLFPSTVISILYGSKYILASNALQLITIGIMIYLILSLSREVLTIMGKTKQIFYFTIIGSGTNIILNLIFIPYFGINGAAFATMITFILISSLIGYYLYRIKKIHPFRKKLILPITLTLFILSLIYLFIDYFDLQTIPFILKIIISILLIIIYFIIILKTKSYDDEDIQLFYLLEKKVGIRFTLMRSIIKKLL